MIKELLLGGFVSLCVGLELDFNGIKTHCSRVHLLSEQLNNYILFLKMIKMLRLKTFLFLI